MSCASEYAPQLRTLGFRVTAQRMAILHVLRHSHGHLSPLQVYAEARTSAPALTRSTVYRTLSFLADNGIVWQTNGANGHVAYELAEGNHNHLVCRECGTQVQINRTALEGAYRQLEAISGFSVDHNHVSFSGLCPDCRRRRSKKRGRKNADDES